MPLDSIQDELTSINSIFDQDTLLPIDEDARLYSLQMPTFPSIILRIKFPEDYPDTTIAIIGTQSVGQHIQKGMGSQVVDIVRSVLESVYQPGEPCIYNLLEEAREALETGSRARRHQSAGSNRRRNTRGKKMLKLSVSNSVH